MLDIKKEFDKEFCALLKKYHAYISVENKGRYGHDNYQIEVTLGFDGYLNYGELYEGEGLNLD